MFVCGVEVRRGGGGGGGHQEREREGRWWWNTGSDLVALPAVPGVRLQGGGWGSLHANLRWTRP